MSQNVMKMTACKILFCSLLTALTFKNSHIYIEIYLIFLKKRPKTNLKVFKMPNFNLIGKT